MDTQPRRPSRTGAVLSTGGEIVGLVMQVLLVYLGADIMWGAEDDNETARLLAWCLFATLYLGATILTLNILVRLEQPDPASTRVLVGHPLTRFLSTLITFGASIIGLSVALELITSIGLQMQNPVQEFAAIWAMMLSWAMFNWGYARIYFSRYHRAQDPPLSFPGTPEPRLVDFVYLAFTNATTFAVSDVKVTSSRMRWTVVWHTTLAFFFNALIIGLVIKVIADGHLFAELFS
ncbi:DUF1345 domain-containing protein [Leucobacter coleopterorum]|nr:DUF1345 domain-containing protein [Leucobacter coleopterorum]